MVCCGRVITGRVYTVHWHSEEEGADRPKRQSGGAAKMEVIIGSSGISRLLGVAKLQSCSGPDDLRYIAGRPILYEICEMVTFCCVSVCLSVCLCICLDVCVFRSFVSSFLRSQLGASAHADSPSK